MLIVRKDQVSVRVPVRLLDGAAAPLIGVTPAILNDSVTANAVGLVKADGSVSSFTVVNAVSWIEVDSGRFPGLYHMVLGVTENDIAGTLQIGVRAAAAQFVTSIVSVEVEEFHIATEVARNSWKIESTGPDTNRLIIFEADGTTPLYKFDLKDVAGNATLINPFERARV